MNSSFQVPDNDAFRWRDSAAGPVLEAAALQPFAETAITTRSRRFRDPHVEDDYAALADVFNVAPSDVLRVRQVHGAVVLIVKPGEMLAEAADADAIVCLDPSRVASVRVADCVPILIADREHEVVAAVHAGWRGTVAGIVGATIRAIEALGVAPARLLAAVGPSIGPCCYQVSGEVREAARSHDQSDRWFAADGGEHWRLDLWTANRDQLIAAGVSADAIATAGLCTADNLQHFYSHRREGADTGRMVAAIRAVRR